MAELRFDGQVALVTGAGGNPGLGRSYARLLAARGAKVVVNDIGFEARIPGTSDNARAATVAAEIVADGGEAVADTNSVADPDGARRAIATAIDAYGRLDILVNNAGACIFAGADEMTDADMAMSINVNLMGVIWMCRAALPHMREQKYGRIVNTTSGGAFGIPLLTSYSAPKAGVIGYTRALAVEIHDAGDIKCNVIGPAGGTRMAVTNMIEGSEQLNMFMSMDPDLAAPMVAFLAHRECPVIAETFQSGMGAASRVWFETSAGITGIRTPEDIRDGFDELLGSAGATEAKPMVGFSELGAKPYVPRSSG